MYATWAGPSSMSAYSIEISSLHPPAGVSVGLGLRGQVETDGQRAAGTVVDHDLLAEFLSELGAEDARDRVGGAAGSLRDDEPDWLVRVLRRRAGRECAGEQQHGQSKHAHLAFLHMRF